MGGREGGRDEEEGLDTYEVTAQYLFGRLSHSPLIYCLQGAGLNLHALYVWVE